MLLAVVGFLVLPNALFNVLLNEKPKRIFEKQTFCFTLKLKSVLKDFHGLGHRGGAFD